MFQKFYFNAYVSRDGDKLFEAGKYSEAEREYRAGAVKVVGPNFKLPATPGEGEGGVRSELYVKMEPWSRANLMGCCVGMAKCLLKRENKEMVLAHRTLLGDCLLTRYRHLPGWRRSTYSTETLISRRKNLYTVSSEYFTVDRRPSTVTYRTQDWMDYTIDLPDLTFRRTVGLCLASEIFLSLGNTGTGVHRRWIACTSTINLSAKHRTPELKRLVDTRAVGKLTELRHPDPQQIPKVDLQVPGLQIRGSWAKLNVGKSGGVTGGRESFSSFIWKSESIYDAAPNSSDSSTGRLYVAGGRKRSLGPWYRDIWVLDLKTRDVWRQLPEYPIEFRTSGMFIGWNMIVHGNKAILVTGRPDVDYFDLETETWGSFRTTYTPTPEDVAAGVKNKWPFPGKTLCDSTMQIANGKLYVFGGTHRTTNIGCNLFMELDLTSKIWRRLSGYPMAPALADYTVPGPRRSASSWISQDKQRFYVMFGQCDREGAKLNGELHAGDEAYAYDDMWSWNFEQEKWRRERLSGNPPCPRSEMSCTYVSAFLSANPAQRDMF